MNIEPRLQEYLQRKDFFNKNNLDQENLEKQYMITNKDEWGKSISWLHAEFTIKQILEVTRILFETATSTIVN